MRGEINYLRSNFNDFKDAVSGILKHLGDMLRSYPTNRCNFTEDCLKKVKAGKHVYIHQGCGFSRSNQIQIQIKSKISDFFTGFDLRYNSTL